MNFKKRTYVPVWGAHIYLTFTDDNQSHLDEGESLLVGTDGFVCITPDGNIDMCIATNDYRTIVHECVHAANIILHLRGVNPEFLNDEAQAYLTDFIFSETIRFLEKIEGEMLDWIEEKKDKKSEAELA